MHVYICVLKKPIEYAYNRLSHLLRLIQKGADILGDGKLNLQRSKVNTALEVMPTKTIAPTCSAAHTSAPDRSNVSTTEYRPDEIATYRHDRPLYKK